MSQCNYIRLKKKGRKKYDNIGQISQFVHFQTLKRKKNKLYKAKNYIVTYKSLQETKKSKKINVIILIKFEYKLK